MITTIIDDSNRFSSKNISLKIFTFLARPEAEVLLKIINSVSRDRLILFLKSKKVKTKISRKVLRLCAIGQVGMTSLQVNCSLAKVSAWSLSLCFNHFQT